MIKQKSAARLAITKQKMIAALTTSDTKGSHRIGTLAKMPIALALAPTGTSLFQPLILIDGSSPRCVGRQRLLDVCSG
jgi:hypothetical protein